jgi:hypothetical protein
MRTVPFVRRRASNCRPHGSYLNMILNGKRDASGIVLKAWSSECLLPLNETLPATVVTAKPSVTRKPAALPLSPINTVRGQHPPGLSNRGVRVPKCCRYQGTVRLAKHSPAVSALKRRFCDNGTKLCSPAASRRLDLSSTREAPVAGQRSIQRVSIRSQV